MKRVREELDQGGATALRRCMVATLRRASAPFARAGLLRGTASALLILALLGTLLSFGSPGDAQDQDVRYFRIGTGAPETSYFAIGGAIASAVSNPPGSRACDQGGSCGVPGLIALAQTTDGSIDNLAQIAAGTLDSGLSQADIAYAAATGTAPFGKDRAMPGLRAIANLYQEGVHVVVHADVALNSVDDLRNRRVAIGPKDSDMAATARLILAAYGLNEKRIKPVYLGLADAAGKFAQRQIDAIIVVGSYPIPALAELAQNTPIKLLALDDEKAQALREAEPYLTVDLIPAGAYQGVGSTVTLGIGALWVVDEKLDPELVYQLTRALWHQSTRRLLDQSGAVGRKIRLDSALVGLPIPLHPGAERFYAEVGKTASPAPPQTAD
jgi:TRAP transporter TAXI family solute receptor